ncbi:MAG: metallophosphoesterase [Planctomycetaceae bacterium]|jgi:predicted MPP superfamily phosphohydrolase|nr:metallophosphoesterase [Planctomycetaceae bacterium]
MKKFSNLDNHETNRCRILNCKKEITLFTLFVLCYSVLFFAVSFARAESEPQTVNTVETTRSSDIELKSPHREDSFKFVIFADRTTGRPEDISILKDAVQDTNRLDPDFVMNIGDLVEGYNSTKQWLEQMQEYKSVMNNLRCPWYPAAGNHDIYGGKHVRDLPKGEHEKEYETHFAPLWYAFEYKNYWFIVLFTDEGNKSGVKKFSDPECQVMSDIQFEWLKSILTKARKADGIFVFQHHPRWLGGGYGNDWDKIHAEFVKAGNVKAVFAGHIHRLTYNEKDNIQYYTLAATGGALAQKTDKIQNDLVQEIHHVSVRKNCPPEITALPVNSTIDLKSMPSGKKTIKKD